MVFEWIVSIIKSAIDSRYTGSIKINFFLGGITNIEKNESVKPPKVVAVVIEQK